MNRKIEDLHPFVAYLCQMFLDKCKKEGLNIIITETLRSKERQDELYAQGRTKTGNIVTNVKGGYSWHNWGVAFDIVPIKNGKADWSDIATFDKCGQIGESFGLEWGGRWTSFIDRPHFQFNFGIGFKDLNNGKKIPDGLFKGMSKNVVVGIVQKLLSEKGYNINGIDGAFGIATENTVKQFQKDNGLAVTGIVDIDLYKILVEGKAMAENQVHWAEVYWKSLNERGIVVNEKRYDENMTRGEVFALMCRVLDKVEKVGMVGK